MEKLNTYISAIFALFITGFFCLIVYVSLLGDNHKINFAVEQFFADIKNRTFATPCSGLNLESQMEAEDCRNRFFLLETAMLMKYNLLGAKDYSIEIKRGHFWVPFFTDDTVSIGVAFTPREDNFIKAFFSRGKTDFTNNLMTVTKKNKVWAVENVDFKADSIEPVLTGLKKEMDMNTYITKTEKGYSLNRIEVDFDTLPPLKKRLFEYSMQKLSAQK